MKRTAGFWLLVVGASAVASRPGVSDAGDTFTIGGAIFSDCANPLFSGVEGVVVTVDGPNGTFTATTGAGLGLWQIDDVPSGSYTVTPEDRDWCFCHGAGDCPPELCEDFTLITVDSSHQAVNQSIKFLAGSSAEDGDGDGVCDLADNCPNNPNPDQVDCNGDGVGDACLGPGDFDGNGAVDLHDYAAFLDCVGSVDAPPDPMEPSCVSACLSAFDLDFDNDVDLEDFGFFQVVFPP